MGQMESLSEMLETSANTSISTNIIINYIFGGSLAFMWGLINAVQIIAHFKMLYIVQPVNAEIFFSMMLNLANFNIIPEETLNEAVVEIFVS